MAKSKPHLSIHRASSEECILPLGKEKDLSSLHRVSSDFSRDINRTPENDENRVHSYEDNGAINSAREGKLTITWNNHHIKKNGYKLSYDPQRDGGNEYEIDKPADVKTPVREKSDTRNVLRNVANIEGGSSIYTPTANNDDAKSVTDNDLDKSRTFITDDTSIPVFDDASSVHTYIIENTAYTRDETPIPEEPLGGTYTIRKSKSDNKAPENIPPDFTYTVKKKDKDVDSKEPRMLTPYDKNEPHLSYAYRKRGKIATVQHVSKLTDPDRKVTEKLPKQSTYKKQSSSDPGETINSLNSSLPPANFKANLFNRVSKVSTPCRVPKFSPVPATGKAKKIPVFKKAEHKDNSVTTKADKSGSNLKDVKRKDLTTISSSQEQKGSSNIPPSKHKFKGIKEALVTDVKDKRVEKNISSQSVGKIADNDRYEDVNLKQHNMDLKPKRHRRSMDPLKGGHRTDQKSASLLRQSQQNRNRSLNNQNTHSGSLFPTKQVIPGAQKEPHSRVNPLLKVNHSIQDTSADVFSESDKRLRLRQAQYISDDLKIVKTKLQDSDFVAQHIDTQMRSTLQKQTALGILNKSNPNPRERNHLIPQKPVSVPIKNSQGRDVLKDDISRNLRNSQIGATSSQDSRLKPNIWRVLPKIHRFNQNKNKNKLNATRSSPVSTATYRTNSVATWVLKSAKNTERLAEIPVVNFTPTKGLPRRVRKSNSKHKLVHAQSKRMRNREYVTDETKHSRDSKENLINSGMYMPLGIKKLKRKPKRLKPKLYTQVGKAKGYESEIPVLYSEEDENDHYPEPRPYTDNMRGRNPYYPSYRRYECENDHVRINYRDPAHKKIGISSGALVRFFRNGDPNDKGVALTVNRKFINLGALLVYLTEKITTPTGVKHVFKWPEGKEMKSVTDFRNRCVYIVSSTNKLNRDVDYGDSREGFWSNKKPSAGLRRHELDLYKRPKSPKDSPTRTTPLVVTIINNLSRDKREKVILNPNTQQTFEEWLEDITNPDMPIQAIFSEKPPYQEIKSFSHLFRELKNNSNFLACGDELLPIEISKKRQAPSSNSSTDSISESRGRKKKLATQSEMGQIYENGRPESPTSTAMSRYDTGPKYPQYGARGRLESRRNTKDRVEIEIDGFIREFYPPTYVDPEDDGTKPHKSLKSEWVYGFKGRDAHQNIIVLPSGELVYYVAGIVVLYDKDRDTQRHYCKHNEEITCMNLHPKQNLIATGQMHGKEPEHASHIRIWDVGSLSTHSVIGLGVFYGGILSIGFCMDGVGNYMCVLDGSEKHVLSVWEWKADRLVARTTTSTDQVHCACFYPDGASNSLLITYGVRHIYFWKIFYDVARKKEAKILRDRNSGIFEEGNFADHLIDEVPKAVNCLVFLNTGEVVTGDSSGNMMIWERDRSDAFTCKFVVQAHNETIMSLCLLDDGTLLSGSGSEIKAWDTDGNFRAIKKRTISQEAGKIRSLVTQTPGGMDGKLYVGTSNSAILDGSLQLKFRYIVQGHTDGVWGVVPHPFEPTFVTAGFDQVVYKWSLVNHKVIWRAHVEAPCTALAIDHRQELIAIGTSDGTFIVLNSYNGMHIATVEVGTEFVGCLAFSPDGSLLALGCNDGLISVYAIHDRGQTYRKFNMALKGHNSGVSKLDWSKDGRCLQSVSVDHELLFWDIDSMQMIKIPRMMRDVDWFTNTCHVAYYLIGPWTNLEKNDVLKVVNRSNYRDLLITGDSRGRIRLYKYPCSKERAEFRGTRVYSSDVTAVAFTPHNSHVLSCGGNDAALVQWQLVDD